MNFVARHLPPCCLQVNQEATAERYLINLCKVFINVFYSHVFLNWYTVSEELLSTDDDDDEFPKITSSRASPDTSQAVWQLVFFILLWQKMYWVSKAAITTLLKFECVHLWSWCSLC